MKVQHHLGQAHGHAHTNTDEDGPCIITWVSHEGQTDSVTCDGWISGGVLFAPSFDEGPLGSCIQDGKPSPEANWYEVSTGSPAVALPTGVALLPWAPEPIEASYDPEPL